MVHHETEFQRIRKAILERDGYKCKICGKPTNAVHHIDGNRSNNNPENLMALCKSCNNVNRVAPFITVRRLQRQRFQRQRFGSEKGTTTKEGKREYMRAYMRWYRAFHETKYTV